MQTEKPNSGDDIAIMETNQGTMKFRIFSELVPNAAKNFIELVNQEKYNNTIFHRVIEDFMIQGGDFTEGNGTGGHAAEGPGCHIDDEYHDDLKNIRGALCYAKTAAPCSIGSQFYIVHPEDGTPFLDHPKNGRKNEGYTVFGQLFEGFDVLDTIAKTKKNRQDKPLEDMIVLSITMHDKSESSEVAESIQEEAE